MVTDFEELYEGIKNFLRANIPDPLGRGVTWIYADYPKELKSLPLVSFVHVGSRREELGVGDFGSRFYHTFDIEVWTSTTSEATIEGQRYAAARLREYLVDQVITLFINKRKQLIKDLGIIDARITGVTTFPYDPDLDLYRKRVTVTFVLEKPVQA